MLLWSDGGRHDAELEWETHPPALRKDPRMSAPRTRLCGPSRAGREGHALRRATVREHTEPELPMRVGAARPQCAAPGEGQRVEGATNYLQHHLPPGSSGVRPSAVDRRAEAPFERPRAA